MRYSEEQPCVFNKDKDDLDNFNINLFKTVLEDTCKVFSLKFFWEHNDHRIRKV